MMSEPPSSPDSLFDELPDEQSPSPDSSLPEMYMIDSVLASRTTPPIPGLYVFPNLLPRDIANQAINTLADQDLFHGGNRNQVMLFSNPSHNSLPKHITSLLDSLKHLLLPLLPSETYSMIFYQPLARQVIYNLYPPGEGISSHTDLPGRYGDGIIGVSLTGGCVMNFTRNTEESITGGEANEDEGGIKIYNVYMPPRTVYVLTEEARWDWAHDIQGRFEDLVYTEDCTDGDDTLGEESAERIGRVETILRDLRVSATFRWMKEGADVLS